MMQNLQYLMWMKNRQLLMNSHFQASSWEEQAFAEDAAGPLGGFVWPPRSYSCTFCGREFKSAQALGGHMNVHRRDRARLKQSLCNENTTSLLPGENITDQDSSASADHHHHNQGTDDFRPSLPFSSSSSSTNGSRASAAVISPENSSEEAYNISVPFSSITNITREKQSLRFPYSSSSFPDHRSNSRTCNLIALRYRIHDDVVETDLSVGLNSQQNDAITIDSKRLKSSTSFPFYHKPCSSERFPFQYSTTVDDIDLELRLGNAPAVK